MLASCQVTFQDEVGQTDRLRAEHRQAKPLGVIGSFFRANLQPDLMGLLCTNWCQCKTIKVDLERFEY